MQRSSGLNVPDVNVLVALFRTDHPHHDAVTAWWRDSASRGEPCTVPDVVWSGFLRVVTNRRLSVNAAGFGEAWSFVQSLVAQPTYVTFIAHTTTLDEFGRLGSEVAATGNLVPDAHIAAHAAAYGGTVVTLDRDFRTFDGLRVLELSA
jgi:toxin-antitoxin system PIN domain toxin